VEAPETDLLAKQKEIEMENEKNYKEAQDTVQTLLSTGKGDNACRSLSKATSDEVTASVKSQQKVLDGMSRGQDCDDEGQELIAKAKSKLDKAKADEANKKKALTDAQTKKINFGDFAVNQLTEGQCSSFFDQQVWKDAKAAIKTAQNNYNTAKATTKAAAAGVEDAKEIAAKMVQECRCKAKKALESTLEKMNSGAKAANTKAWTKAAHLLCVLDGKSPSNCVVKPIPVVKMVSLSKDVQKACAIQDEWDGDGLKSSGASNGRLFELFKLQPVAIGADDTSKYIDICKKEGLLPVGCGTSSYDCNKYRGGKCVNMPSSWGCNMMTTLGAKTGFGKDIFAFCTGIGYGCTHRLYTPYNRYPNGSVKYSPVCGKFK